jgi:hypothetical protein
MPMYRCSTGSCKQRRIWALQKAKTAVDQTPPGSAQTAVEQMRPGEAQADVGRTAAVKQIRLEHNQ